MKYYEAIAKTADEAIEIALNALNVTIDEVDIEIYEEQTKGFFGFLKSKDVRVIAKLRTSVEEKAKLYLNDILNAMGIVSEVTYKKSDDSLVYNVSGQDMALVIGRRGQTLDSLQYLLSLVVNKDSDNYTRVVLDTEDYRNKREASLEKLANKLAYKVKKTRKEVVLEPMNPYERRIIHASLQNNKYVSTRSEGEDPNRKVVIYLK